MNHVNLEEKILTYNFKQITMKVQTEDEKFDELPLYIIAQDQNLVEMLIKKGTCSKEP